MNSLLLLCSCLAASALAMPYPMAFPDDGYAVPHVVAPVYGAPPPPVYADAPVGRVKMQIYRGPSEAKGKHGYETDYWAPWGYYATVPEDQKRVSYH